MNLSTCAVVGLELGEFVVLGFRIVEERVMRLLKGGLMSYLMAIW